MKKKKRITDRKLLDKLVEINLLLLPVVVKKGYWKWNSRYGYVETKKLKDHVKKNK